MKKFTSLALILFVISSMTMSCTKYDDGPMISFRSAKERVSNNWKVEYAFRNLFDVTEDFNEYRSEVEFYNDGSVEFRTWDEMDSLWVQEGLWFLVDKKESIEVHYTEPLVDPDRLKMRILKLNEEKLWVSYTVDDTSNYEVRYIPAGGTE